MIPKSFVPRFEDCKRELYGGGLLICGMSAFSTLGVVVRYMPGVGGLTKSTWRTSSMLFSLFPLFVFTWISHFGGRRGGGGQQQDIGEEDLSETGREDHQRPSLHWRDVYTNQMILWILSAAFFTSAFGGAWIWSIDHTSLAHSYMFSNMHSLFIVLFSFLLGYKPSTIEIVGSFTGFVGVMLMLIDLEDDANKVTLAGDLAALFSSVMVVGYIMATKKVLKHMPLYLYLFPMHVASSISTMFQAVAFGGASWRHPFDPNVGLFGYLSAERWWVGLYFGLFAGLLGVTGYSGSLKYLSSLTVSLAMLLEPVLGILIGIALSVEKFPGFWTLVGSFVTLCAMVAVTFAGEKKGHGGGEGEEGHEMTNVVGEEN